MFYLKSLALAHQKQFVWKLERGNTVTYLLIIEQGNTAAGKESYKQEKFSLYYNTFITLLHMYVSVNKPIDIGFVNIF